VAVPGAGIVVRNTVILTTMKKLEKNWIPQRINMIRNAVARKLGFHRNSTALEVILAIA
jgi:hypothetical protein